MKRILSFFLCFLVVISLGATCYADFDLSGLSFDELVALKDQINLAIWNSEEWQEVEVPQGIWEVGADIPAGKYTIKAIGGTYTRVNIGDHTVYDGTTVAAFVFQSIYATDATYYKEGETLSEWVVELEGGQFVGIENATAIFTPYNGKPSLGFK